MGTLFSVPVERPMLSLLMAFSTIAAAATPPPQLPFGDLDWEAHVHKAPAVGLRMGRLTVSFEKTPLREVMRNAGGVIAHQGDAGESVYWLCYTIVEKKHSERLSLTASGEMGGPDQTVSSVVRRVSAIGFLSTKVSLSQYLT
jgi:hypothetical protein